MIRRWRPIPAQSDPDPVTTSCQATWSVAAVLSIGLLYLAFMFLPLVPLPTATSSEAYAPAFVYFLGLSAQVLYHSPPTSPGLSGTPLHYEWFVFFHMAAIAQVTRLAIPTIALRLDLTTNVGSGNPFFEGFFSSLGKLNVCVWFDVLPGAPLSDQRTIAVAELQDVSRSWHVEPYRTTYDWCLGCQGDRSACRHRRHGALRRGCFRGQKETPTSGPRHPGLGSRHFRGYLQSGGRRWCPRDRHRTVRAAGSHCPGDLRQTGSPTTPPCARSRFRSRTSPASPA